VAEATALGSLELLSEIDMRVDMAISMSIMIELLDTFYVWGDVFVLVKLIVFIDQFFKQLLKLVEIGPVTM
jgi:hypothetical protein